MILIHYTPGTELPAPWQPNWQAARTLDIPGLPSRDVARAADGTPIPAGAAVYVAPVVTHAHRALAREYLAGLSESRDMLDRELARVDLNDHAALDRDILAALGVVHPYALLAPLSVETLDAACRAHVAAADAWTSPLTSVVVRTAYPTGFDVWIGIGSLLDRVGRASDYAAAEHLGVEALRKRRAEVMRRVREEILAGWSPETPFYSATLATAETELAFHVRRGPLTSGELLTVAASGAAMPASSWDLPIVAEYRGASVIRHDERVTWADDDSRARQRARQNAGELQRKEEEQRAIALLREVPALAPLVTPRGLQRGASIELGNGMTVVAQGPVRMREDGRVALALVEMPSGHKSCRTWLAIGEFL